ncbi:TPA: hypothetical protein ACKQEK_004543, partial [Serratia marcescens]
SAGCPSPVALFRRTRLWRVFRFLEYGLSIELRSIIRSEDLTLRASAKALFNTAPAPVVRVRSPYSEEPAYGGFFAFWGTDSPSLHPMGCNFALQVDSLERAPLIPNYPNVKRTRSYSVFIECFIVER